MPEVDPKTGRPEASDKTKRLEALETGHEELASRVKAVEDKVEALTPEKPKDDEGEW